MGYYNDSRIIGMPHFLIGGNLWLPAINKKKKTTDFLKIWNKSYNFEPVLWA